VAHIGALVVSGRGWESPTVTNEPHTGSDTTAGHKQPWACHDVTRRCCRTRLSIRCACHSIVSFRLIELTGMAANSVPPASFDSTLHRHYRALARLIAPTAIAEQFAPFACSFTRHIAPDPSPLPLQRCRHDCLLMDSATTASRILLSPPNVSEGAVCDQLANR